MYKLFHSKEPDPRLYTSVASGPILPATWRAKEEGFVVPIPTLPFWVITKRFSPLEEAVKRSPVPELSTTSAANDVAPETEATGRVPFSALTSKVPREGTVPTPSKLLTVVVPVVLPIVVFAPAPEAKTVVLFEESVVKAAVDGVVNPIAVELIPVAVVLKLPLVNKMLLEPVLIEALVIPVRLSVPDVAVRFNAPVVWVKPFCAVRSALEVMVPRSPVVVREPLVVALPFSSTVREVNPLFLTTKALFTAALVSLITTALPVPALVSASPVVLPLLFKTNEVAVPRPDARVKTIFRPVVVVMLLPVSYACCKVTLSGFGPQEEI